MLWRAVGFALIHVAVATAQLVAQEPSAVSGYVADNVSSELIPAATVTLVTTGEVTTSGPDGSFAFLEAPDGPISVRVEASGYQGVVWETEVVEGRPLFLEVLLSRLEGDAALHLVVTDQASGAPLAGADVSLPEIGVSAETSETGEALISNLPTGRWLVVVGGLGYGAASSFVDFVGSTTIEGDVALGEEPIPLDGIVVTVGAAPVMSGKLQPFYERMNTTSGSFLTREDFEERNSRTIVEALQGVQGIRVSPPSVDGNGWAVLFARAARSLTACPSPAVYLDGIFVGGGNEYVDINALAAISDLEGIELYGGISQIPIEFNRTGSSCGVIVIWTR